MCSGGDHAGLCEHLRRVVPSSRDQVIVINRRIEKGGVFGSSLTGVTSLSNAEAPQYIIHAATANTGLSLQHLDSFHSPPASMSTSPLIRLISRQSLLLAMIPWEVYVGVTSAMDAN